MCESFLLISLLSVAQVDGGNGDPDAGSTSNDSGAPREPTSDVGTATSDAGPCGDVARAMGLRNMSCDELLKGVVSAKDMSRALEWARSQPESSFTAATHLNRAQLVTAENALFIHEMSVRLVADYIFRSRDGLQRYSPVRSPEGLQGTRTQLTASPTVTTCPDLSAGATLFPAERNARVAGTFCLNPLSNLQGVGTRLGLSQLHRRTAVLDVSGAFIADPGYLSPEQAREAASTETLDANKLIRAVEFAQIDFRLNILGLGTPDLEWRDFFHGNKAVIRTISDKDWWWFLHHIRSPVTFEDKQDMALNAVTKWFQTLGPVLSDNIVRAAATPLVHLTTIGGERIAHFDQIDEFLDSCWNRTLSGQPTVKGCPDMGHDEMASVRAMLDDARRPDHTNDDGQLDELIEDQLFDADLFSLGLDARLSLGFPFGSASGSSSNSPGPTGYEGLDLLTESRSERPVSAALAAAGATRLTEVWLTSIGLKWRAGVVFSRDLMFPLFDFRSAPSNAARGGLMVEYGVALDWSGLFGIRRQSSISVGVEGRNWLCDSAAFPFCIKDMFAPVDKLRRSTDLETVHRELFDHRERFYVNVRVALEVPTFLVSQFLRGNARSGTTNQGFSLGVMLPAFGGDSSIAAGPFGLRTPTAFLGGDTSFLGPI